ncbi:DUF4878 domain-containing protein [Gordonia zhaorongruii]|uniref:DUF4878 domain-containing protein n=1 Tax=Gordonia zhaorongruii TaxID=2597659 RepID=UPI00117EA2FD|nr:DUF4878 domain-containing protein [Gordonia zhaorongruii]
MGIISHLRRPIVAAVAVAAGAAIALTGCSSDDSSDSGASSSTSAAAGQSADEQSADQKSTDLDNSAAQDILRKAVDPATPAADLDGLVEISNPGVKAAITGYAKGSSAAGYTPDVYTVKSVKADGDKAEATVAVKSPHTPEPVEMTFNYVKVDGAWKLAADAVETLTSMGRSHG